MASPYESANLIIKLYDLRREETMRKAREWYRVQFHPDSAQDVIDVIRGEHSAYYRMVATYWEMAASFVNHEAIDWKMFMDANGGEPVNVFAKVEPFLPKLREMFDSKHSDTKFHENLEKLVMRLPNAREQLAERREMFKQARARWESENTKQPA